MSEYYIKETVSRAALAVMYDEFRKQGVNCHTFEMYIDETCLARISSEPYSCADKRENYSLSKSFTSAAIGIAVTEGVLSLDDRLVDLFPDKLPGNVSENLRKMTVRHLLTLSAGHKECVLRAMSDAEDAASVFLAEPVIDEPGTKFCYDTGATCMLGIVLKRLTGRNVLEYLAEKFFPVAGISGVWWNQTKDGSTECGVGLHASCDDIARFGILFAGGGVIGGKRLISEEYIREAGSPQINILNDGQSPTHDTGYGFQFWMKRDDGFDAEGSYGQYCFIFPSKHLTIAMQTESQPGHDPVPAIYKMIDHMFDPDEKAITVKPNEYLPLTCAGGVFPFSGKMYRLSENPMGITLFSLSAEGEELLLRFSDGHHCQTITAGNEKFIVSEWQGVYMLPKLGIMRNGYRETLRAACSYCIQNDEVVLEARLLNNPHVMTLRFVAEANTCKITVTTTLENGMAPGCDRLTGTEI